MNLVLKYGERVQNPRSMCYVVPSIVGTMSNILGTFAHFSDNTRDLGVDMLLMVA